jgi:hypothetical protein
LLRKLSSIKDNQTNDQHNKCSRGEGEGRWACCRVLLSSRYTYKHDTYWIRELFSADLQNCNKIITLQHMFPWKWMSPHQVTN